MIGYIDRYFIDENKMFQYLPYDLQLEVIAWVLKRNVRRIKLYRMVYSSLPWKDVEYVYYDDYNFNYGGMFLYQGEYHTTMFFPKDTIKYGCNYMKQKPKPKPKPKPKTLPKVKFQGPPKRKVLTLTKHHKGVVFC